MECDVLTVANRIVENMVTMIQKLQKERIVVTVGEPQVLSSLVLPGN